MAGFKIDLRGHEVLAMTIANAHANAVAQSVKVVKNNTEELKAKAHSMAPEDTGFLKNNIVTRYEGMSGIVHSQAGYSGYQEYGTRYQSGTPFMRPALNFIYPKYQKDMTDVMKGVFR